MEKRWLCLARNYEFAEQLSNFKPGQLDKAKSAEASSRGLRD
jgi:hypothetical protein